MSSVFVTTNLIKVGSFTLGRRAVIIDTCYQPEEEGGTLIVRSGKWNAYVSLSESEETHTRGRTAALIATHDSVVASRSLNIKSWAVQKHSIPPKKFYLDILSKWRRKDTMIVVDSGMAGIFDCTTYKWLKDAESTLAGFGERFSPESVKKLGDDFRMSSYCLEHQNKTTHACVVDPLIKGSIGCCSSAGWGDGFYPVYVMTQEGIAGIMVDFLSFYPMTMEAAVIKSLTPEQLPTLVGVDMEDESKALLESRLKGETR